MTERHLDTCGLIFLAIIVAIPVALALLVA
jgi:hypothetical protein